MAILRDTNDLNRLPQSASAVEKQRARDFDAATRQSRDAAFDLGGQLLGLLQILPASMLASGKAERERLIKRYGENDARVTSISEAITDAEGVQLYTDRGIARAKRTIEAMQMPGSALFGFLTDPSGAALSGYGVRLTGKQAAEAPQATTADDGYFRISLPASTGTTSAANAAAGELGKAGDTATVVVLDRDGRQVYMDPLALQLDAGSAYREYQVDPPPQKR